MSILQHMGRRNYLIEGLSRSGKTSVCDELQRRGHHAIHGDRELAYQGDPETGEPTEGSGHEHHIWNVDRVKALVADRNEAVTFFCGGSRNFSKFIDLFDGVFVLEVDLATLHRRLDERPDDEWGGGTPTERELIVRWHQREKTFRSTALSSTPPHRLSTLSTRSFVDATRLNLGEENWWQQTRLQRP